MKRNLVFVLFALVSVVGFSQVSWNAKVGMNISNFTGDFDMNAKVGFKIGGGMEYGFNEIWSLQPSLFVSSKGNGYQQRSRKNSGGICGGHRADGASFLKIPPRCRLCCTPVAGLVAGESPVIAGFFPYQQPKQQKNKRKYKL